MRSHPLSFLSAVSLFIVIIFHASSVFADDVAGTMDNHIVPKVSGQISVDALLDESFWNYALILELKYEVQPGENIPAPVRTEVLLAYSESHLYAAFRAYDPDPSSIRARLCDRDDIGGEDWVGLVLDTFNDERRAFDFLVNPLGVQADMIECSDCGSDNFDAIWESSGRITQWGYVVEIAIPFSSLRFQRTDGDQVWGFDAVRSYPRSARHHIGLFARDRGNNCYFCQTLKIKGFAGASPGRNIEIAPTFSALYSQEREGYTSGDFREKDKSYDPGLTARWSMTPNMALQGTVNPDFSQVEADAAQLDINRNFAIHYPEKRPFFMEGAELFSTRMNAVYSRTLADPDWGIKLTGKEGGNAVGFYSVRDARTNFLFPGSQGSMSSSLDMESYGTVLRYKRDIFESSNIGLLATDREGEGYYNRVVGVDGLIKLTKTDQIRFQVIASETDYPDSLAAEFGQQTEPFRGSGALAIYAHETENLDLFGYYFEKAKDLRLDSGFEPKTNIRHFEGGGGYKWYGESDNWYTLLHAGSSYELEEEIDGSKIFELWNIYGDYAGPLQSEISLWSHVYADFVYRGEHFSYKHYHLFTSMRPTGSLRVYFNHTWGDIVDYANARQARTLQLEPGFEYRFGRHLNLGYDHTWERLSVLNGQRLYTANVGRFRLKYQFDRRTFLRINLQYVRYDRNTGLYLEKVDSKEDNLFSQILFSYKINPQTVFYLGYSDNYYGFTGSGADPVAVDLTQTDRTFFVKFGYAWIL
ncbi:MAG: carbohydrate binding family 9 domain-containing protein [Bacteroidales bacterium]|nr:carbohydrate binding family 9 domain-containing protein [Candidatus Latescibacterota bacterium]